MVFFLFGADTWHKNLKLKQLTGRFVKEVDPSKMNLSVYSAGSIDEATLRSALRAAPFLARKRMVVMKNFLTQSKRKGFAETLNELLPSLVDEERMVIISEDEEKPKKWGNIATQTAWEYLEKHAQCEEFKAFWGAKLEAAIVTQAKAHGLAMEKNAAEFFAVLSGGDLGHTEKEIEKLAHYCGDRKATVADIKLLCTIEGEANIFEFLDALGTKEQKALLSTAQGQFDQVEPLALVSRANGHLRALFAMTLAGQPGATALKLHPFQARKISAQIRNWTVPALKRFLFALMAIEYQAKRGLAPDPRTQLTALLARIGMR